MQWPQVPKDMVISNVFADILGGLGTFLVPRMSKNAECVVKMFGHNPSDQK